LERRNLAQSITDPSRHAFGDCALVIETGRTARHPQSDRCSWGEILLPGQSRRLSDQLRKAVCSKRTETHQDAACRAEMKVGKVEVCYGPLELHSSGFVFSDPKDRRLQRHRQQTERTELLGREGFKTWCCDSKHPKHG
jgi:hypothetical protein